MVCSTLEVRGCNIEIRVAADLRDFAEHLSPLRLPSPGSITSVAREPTTMPTFGTIGTLLSGITRVFGELHRGVFLHQGSGAGPRWAAAGAVSSAQATSRKRAVRAADAFIVRC